MADGTASPSKNGTDSEERANSSNIIISSSEQGTADTADTETASTGTPVHETEEDVNSPSGDQPSPAQEIKSTGHPATEGAATDVPAEEPPVGGSSVEELSADGLKTEGISIGESTSAHGMESPRATNSGDSEAKHETYLEPVAVNSQPLDGSSPTLSASEDRKISGSAVTSAGSKKGSRVSFPDENTLDSSSIIVVGTSSRSSSKQSSASIRGSALNVSISTPSAIKQQVKSVLKMQHSHQKITNKEGSRIDQSSLTQQILSKQIRTGKHTRLTSVVVDENGHEQLIQTGQVPQLQTGTVNISLAGSQRPMSKEECRRGEHNCFDGLPRRKGRLPIAQTHGHYPTFMRHSSKLNEFVATSILEKLRVKGLAVPRRRYHGRELPSSLLAEMVLKPEKNHLTTRYFFGYEMPPNRPRVNQLFRKHLLTFIERHRVEQSDHNFGVAFENVRVMSQRPGSQWPLSDTLAAVVRSQEEPGFGTQQLRRRKSAV